MNTPNPSPPEMYLQGLSSGSSRRLVAAAQALMLGRTWEAEPRLRNLLELYPDHPEVLRMYAGLLSLYGDSNGARLAMERAISLRPDDAAYWSSLGSALIESALYDDAIAALKRACELDPSYYTAWYNLGLALIRSMRAEEAEKALREAISLAPDDSTHARAILGDMFRAEGQLDAAVSEYRAILARKPNAGPAWWGLADIKTQRFSDEDFEQLQRAMQLPDAGERDLTAMGYALAKALDDRRRYAESLAALAQVHSRVRMQRIWDASAHHSYIENILRTFSRPQAVAEESLGSEVVFVTSLPRSGSTLVEQVLASHSMVSGGGELSDLSTVLQGEARRTGLSFPEIAVSRQPADWARMGREYLDRTAHLRRNHSRFTDKMPSNWMYIGAIRAMLPAARIIIVRRDPLETCFSCYRQSFANSEYTHTFPDLAAAWRDFDHSAKHWLALHPGNVYESVYEELVVDPETKIRALLEFCGLPFETACLEFHKTERKVHTPSATQVREPMRRDTARSHRYGALLDPLRAELGMPLFSGAS